MLSKSTRASATVLVSNSLAAPLFSFFFPRKPRTSWDGEHIFFIDGQEYILFDFFIKNRLGLTRGLLVRLHVTEGHSRSAAVDLVMLMSSDSYKGKMFSGLSQLCQTCVSYCLHVSLFEIFPRFTACGAFLQKNLYPQSLCWPAEDDTGGFRERSDCI